jgi:hypothetical protein
MIRPLSTTPGCARAPLDGWAVFAAAAQDRVHSMAASSQPRRWGGLRNGQVLRIVRCDKIYRPIRVQVKAAFRPLEAI